MGKEQLIVITGPTASGKTAKAVSLAREIDAEIISADSRQIYRGMDIGTGKDLCEYGPVPYHLINIADAGYKYNLYEYLRDFHKAKADIESRGKVPLLCGGTGLYVESALKGISLPEVPSNQSLRDSLEQYTLEELAQMLGQMKSLHNITDIDTKKRAIRAIEIEKYYQEHPEEAQKAKPHPIENALVIGVDIPRDERRMRIKNRLVARLQEGMVDEIESLLKSGVNPDDLLYYGLEYKFVTLYVTGQMSYGEMVEKLEIAICQFAKRQMTWFRGMERRGIPIHWLPWNLPEDEFNARVVALMKS